MRECEDVPKPLFDRLIVYHDTGRSRQPISSAGAGIAANSSKADPRAASGALNMAIDEALLEFSREPALRFYGWERPSLSFGYFGKFAEVEEAGRQFDLVRRWTGGGSVWHGEDLTYSLVTPAAEPVFRRGPAAIYLALHAAMRDALLRDGLRAEIASISAPKISDACFANPVRDDLILGDRKIAGAAQRRTRAGFLQQGSIQLPGLSQEFRDRLSRALAAMVETREIPPVVLERAALIARQKYATDDWLRRC